MILVSLIGSDDSGKQEYLDKLVPNNNLKNKINRVMLFNPIKGKNTPIIEGHYDSFNLTTIESPEMIKLAKIKTLFISYENIDESIRYLESNNDIIKTLSEIIRYDDSLYSVIITSENEIDLHNEQTEKIMDFAYLIDSFYIGLITNNKEFAIESNKKRLQKPYEFETIGAGIIIPLIYNLLADKPNINLDKLKEEYQSIGLI